jgi:hypothetical protein
VGILKLKISHNMDEVQLEEALEKALRGMKPYNEPKRVIPDKLANQIKDEANDAFKRVVYNMLSEIQTVINKS